jgi:hypothetical protein
MIKTFYSIIFIVSCLLLSCTTPVNQGKIVFLTDFRQFVKDTELHYTNYNAADWELSYKTFKNLQDRYPAIEKDLTAAESEEVDNLKGQFAAVVTKDKTHQVKVELRHLFNQATSMVRHLSK